MTWGPQANSALPTSGSEMNVFSFFLWKLSCGEGEKEEGWGTDKNVHLIMCLESGKPLKRLYYLWRNVCLGLFSTFWLGCLFFWYWIVWAACIFWKLILCQLFHLLLFSPILRVVFSAFLRVSFAVQKLLSLIRSHLFALVFISITLGCGS